MAPMMYPIAKAGTSIGVAPPPKKRPVLKEKRLPPPIMLPGYIKGDDDAFAFLRPELVIFGRSKTSLFVSLHESLHSSDLLVTPLLLYLFSF